MNQPEEKPEKLKPAENRRNAWRLPVATMAHFTPRGEQITIKATVRDISTQGMGAAVDYPYQKGEKILVKITLTSPSHKVIEGSVIGWVTRVSQNSSDDPYVVGLEFREMEKQDPKLYSYLQGLEAFTRPT